MSNITILHTNQEVFFGSDSAVSTKINDQSYRMADDGQKLFVIDDMLIFCSGPMIISRLIMTEFFNSKDKSILNLQKIAVGQRPYIDDDSSFLSILVGRFEEDQVVVYILPSYDDFKIERKVVNHGEIGVWTGGFKTKESFEMASDLVIQKKTVYIPLSKYTSTGEIEHRRR